MPTVLIVGPVRNRDADIWWDLRHSAEPKKFDAVVSELVATDVPVLLDGRDGDADRFSLCAVARRRSVLRFWRVDAIHGGEARRYLSETSMATLTACHTDNA